MLIHRNRPCAESRRQAHTGDSVAWNGSPAGTPCSARLCTLTTLLQPGPRRGPSSRPAQVAAARGGLSCEPVTELDGSTPQTLAARLASPRPPRAGATQQHSPHPPPGQGGPDLWKDQWVCRLATRQCRSPAGCWTPRCRLLPGGVSRGCRFPASLKQRQAHLPGAGTQGVRTGS